MSWPTGRGEAALSAPTRHSACHRCPCGSLSVTSTEDRESVRLPDLVAAMVGTVLLRTRRADPTGAQAAAAAGCLRRTQPGGFGATRGLEEQAGATAGASSPLRQSARGCPLRDQR